MMYHEITMNENIGVNSLNKGGLMMVGYGGTYEFQINDEASYGRGLNFYNKGEEFSKRFNNIGIGVGCLFAKLTIHTDYPYNSQKLREAPTAQQWWEAVTYYYGKTNPDGSIDIIACEEYANGVWSLFRTGYDQLGNQIWSIESQNWVKYYGNYKNWWDSKGWVMPIW